MKYFLITIISVVLLVPAIFMGYGIFVRRKYEKTGVNINDINIDNAIDSYIKSNSRKKRLCILDKDGNIIVKFKECANNIRVYDNESDDFIIIKKSSENLRDYINKIKNDIGNEKEIRIFVDIR
ncbi:hypothetical protein GN330_10650 [Nitratireductor sp. CAU 1489]|uniref:Uncharacterized protein n=1 Tax=Nitratireductor arenosus TaxID=2682096 RepID=A0A844QEF7_9HYPH|nr:hypothetical protein [Nitratireductor arenosus]MVA97702.1 hypothetical protein [Nitratireductor arenosus]